MKPSLQISSLGQVVHTPACCSSVKRLDAATKAFIRHPTDMARHDLGIKGQAGKKRCLLTVTLGPLHTGWWQFSAYPQASSQLERTVLVAQERSSFGHGPC